MESLAKNRRKLFESFLSTLTRSMLNKYKQLLWTNTLITGKIGCTTSDLITSIHLTNDPALKEGSKYSDVCLKQLIAVCMMTIQARNYNIFWFMLSCDCELNIFDINLLNVMLKISPWDKNQPLHFWLSRGGWKV